MRLTIKPTRTELVLLSAAVGLVATYAAPWMELRGTFAAWRITEWHAFWRGSSAFLLSDVVARDYTIPVEFATTAMQNTVSALFLLGVVLGAWHSIVIMTLVLNEARRRWRAGSPAWRVGMQEALILLVSTVALYSLAYLFALPSSLSLKVDFRSQGDVHASSLIWSTVNVFPGAPLLAVLAALVQMVALTPILIARLQHSISSL
jgi:hypothetical protein